LLQFIGRRLLTVVPLLILVTLAVFLLLDLAPGDAATTIAGDDASAERIAQIRAELGLDQPLLVRFGEFLAGVFQGDLGSSPITGQEVSDVLLQRLPISLSLVGLAMVFAFVIGCTAGTVAALHRNGWVDRVVNGISALFMAVPSFVVGIVLVLVFALTLSWFPATGYAPLSEGIGPWLQFTTLPALALAGVPAAQIARQTRGALIDALEEDYIRTARAKGLRKPLIVGKHAAKNAAIPVITVMGVLLGALIGGSVVIERVFAIPGIGSLSVDAVLSRDLPTLQGVVLVSAIAVIFLNLLVDVAYGYLNPQVRIR
jgi:peptide/nickel transport system permease protein